MATNPFEETARAGGQRGYTAPSRSYNEPPSERVWEPSRRDEPTVTTGGERQYIKSPILKRDDEIYGPSVPEGFRSKDWVPRFRSKLEYENWKMLKKAQERMQRVKSWLDPFIADEDIKYEWSGILGPAWGSLSIDPIEGEESLIGAAGLNVGPFSTIYEGGPGTDEMIDLIARVGPFRADYNLPTDVGALQGGIDFGPFNIMGGIDTLKNKQLALQLGLEFSKGGIVNLL